MKPDDNMASTSSSSLRIQGFTVIKVKANENCEQFHCLYLKPHTSELKSDEWPQKRTLQVHNVPPYCNEANIKLIFQSCGKVVKVYFQKKFTSVPQIEPSIISPQLSGSIKNYKIAIVVFKEQEAVKKACDLRYDHIRLLSNANTPLCNVGIAGYLREYKESIVDLAELEKGANSYLEEYYRQQDEKEEKEKSKEGLPDDDGFIKVTRHGRNKGMKRTEESERRGRERHRQRKRKNELNDFYKFQFRETKRQYIAELQTKFEEDKKRIQEMKSARKFRPVA